MTHFHSPFLSRQHFPLETATARAQDNLARRLIRKLNNIIAKAGYPWVRCLPRRIECFFFESEAFHC